MRRFEYLQGQHFLQQSVISLEFLQMLGLEYRHFA